MLWGQKAVGEDLFSSLGVKAEREERVRLFLCYEACNKFEKLELEDGKKVKVKSTNKWGDRTLMRHLLSPCQASIDRNWLHLSSGSNESYGNPKQLRLFWGPLFAHLKFIVTSCCWQQYQHNPLNMQRWAGAYQDTSTSTSYYQVLCMLLRERGKMNPAI